MSTSLVNVRLLDLSEQATRPHVVETLQHESELLHSEQIAHLIDYLQDAWETFDWLTVIFGEKDALKLLTVPSCDTDIPLSEDEQTMVEV